MNTSLKDFFCVGCDHNQPMQACDHNDVVAPLLVVFPLAVVALMVLQFAPLFACVDASLILVGHVIGLLYSMLW